MAKQRESKRQPESAPKAASGKEPSGGERPTERGVPVVGIGASAGGLEALEAFLRNVPKESGAAFVIVQHLDPTHKGVMVELLQRATPMPVAQIRDRMKAAPDSVYVIPPNRDLSILHGVLHLLEPTEPRGLRLPIDSFFRALAEDQRESSVGVILSGMGSDGTLGLRAIKEMGGAVFIQSVESARFNGMPQSAIDTGYADMIAPVEELPARIVAYLSRRMRSGRAEPPLGTVAQGALEKIFILLRSQTGHDFSQYKRTNVYRRVARRMGLHQIDRINFYVRYMQENPHEVQLLFKELLIGVTSFFRDPHAWESLGKKALPQLLASRPSGIALRAWIPGCSTGEEAYSLAITFQEVVEKLQPGKNFSLQIFATDLDRDAIDTARAGLYPANIASDVKPERMRRFFVEEPRGFRVDKEIRKMVVFAPQNLTMDPPFTKLDILICRNLLIYLTAELQKRLLPLFHYSLNPGGILFLGSAETVGTFTKNFAAIDGKARLYRRLENGLGQGQVDFPAAFPPPPSVSQPPAIAQRPAPNLQALADQLLVAQFAPPAVLTNREGEILYFSGRTGNYLEPASGKANLSLFAMARDGLNFELTGAFSRAIRKKETVTLPALEVKRNDGTVAVDVTVRPLDEPEALKGMVLIVFREVPLLPAAAPPPSAPAKRRAMAALEKEHEERLRRSFDELRTTREEMQASQEELRSMNEELQSTNEELQSTNEELTTSKEEMQSMNEELQTVNNELQTKLSDLARANNDMKNLLDSTDIATLFLDEQLRVRRFTNRTSQIMSLLPADTGRPFTDIASQLLYPEMAEDARSVIRSLVVKEREVTSRDSRWYAVRIMPYRTLENMINGVVITFTDITAFKVLEAELRRAKEDLEARAPNRQQAAKPGRKG